MPHAKPQPALPRIQNRLAVPRVVGLLPLLALPLAASCGFATLEADIARTQHAAGDLITAPLPPAQRTRPLVVVHDAPYLPSERIAHSASLWLHETVEMRVSAMPFDRCLQRALEQLQIQPSVVFAADLDGGVDDPNGALKRSKPVTLDHRGTFRAFLDLLGEASGFGWEQKAGALHWMAEISRTFEVHRVPGDITYSMQTARSARQVVQAGGGGGGGSGGVTAGPTGDAELSISLGPEFWLTLEEALTSLLGAGRRPIIDRTTATVTVRGPAGRVRAVGRHIAAINAWLGRQVLLEVQLVTVDLSDDRAAGINWEVVNQAASSASLVSSNALGNASTNALGLGVSAPSLGVRLAGSGAYSGTTAILHALASQGQTSVRSAPRLVALNGQAAQIQVLSDRAILGEVEVTTRDTVGATTQERLSPSTVSTGVALTILPKIVGDRVFLQASIQVSDLVALESAGRSGGQTIQLPTVSRNQFFQSARLGSGETLALGGMSVERGNAQDQSIGRFRWLGARSRQSRRSEMVLLITPTLLDAPAPDEPAL